MPAAPLVRFSGVRKSYDGRTLVVRNLDLDVAEGEFLTLLGPSGSGKTTTLMLLAGFEAPTGGQILLQGRDITSLPPHKRGIGVVFQNYALFPHMSVAENIAYPLRARGVGAAEVTDRVQRALDMVKLSGMGGRRPAQLSGGQQQRVALARALVFEPPLILLDEPLGALDKQLREQMQHELMQIHERLGITMVYVTHDQVEALTMSDRIAIFNDGAIQQLAAPTELYMHPANAFVASFVGESNRIHGEVVRVTSDRVTLRTANNVFIEAVPVDALLKGEMAVASFRPEHVIIGCTSTPDTNRLELPVDRCIYLGDTAKAVMRLAPDQEIFAKLDPVALGRIVRGQVKTVSWQSHHCLAFRRPELV
jgi:putative spermidine/putrescine transport system ATP-binding protein